MERQNWNIKDTQTFSNHHVQILRRRKKMKNFSHFLFAMFILHKTKTKKMFYTICHFFLLLIMSLHPKHQGTYQSQGTKEHIKYDKVVTHLNKHEMKIDL